MQVETLLRLLFLATWATIPYLIVSTAHNQDFRLMAPAMPGMAVIVAGAVAAVPRLEARAAIAGLATVAMLYLTVSHVVHIDPPLLPDEVSVRAGDYSASISLDDRPIGYERLPESSIGDPIMSFMEETAAAETGRPPERRVCMMQSEAVINTNTFNYLTISRGDPFVIVNLLVGPTGRAGLAANLHECDFGLYMKPASAAEIPTAGWRSSTTNTPPNT